MAAIGLLTSEEKFKSFILTKYVVSKCKYGVHSHKYIRLLPTLISRTSEITIKEKKNTLPCIPCWPLEDTLNCDIYYVRPQTDPFAVV